MQDAINTFLIQFILVYFLQSIIFVFCLYVLSNKRVDRKNFLATSIVFMLGTLLIRALPIHFGVHTLICMLLLILLGNKMLALSIHTAIKASLFALIILLSLESLNVLLFTLIFGHQHFNVLMANSWTKNLLGLVVNLSFLLTVTIIYLWKRRVLSRKNTDLPKGESKR